MYFGVSSVFRCISVFTLTAIIRRLSVLASFFRGTQTVRDKCYVTHWGVGVSAFPEKSVMKVLLFNVISIMRWWVGVKERDKVKK